ncbi:MAG: hypothetical protein KDA28_02110, partial [Phycisphaerales bacterium]|nr:hypothetical protein [Phycisphaerales bacterium]
MPHRSTLVLLGVTSLALGQSVHDVRTGLLDLRQIDPDNNWTSIEVTIPASSILFSETSHNRADVNVGFGSGDDLQRGIVMASSRSRARDNASGGGNLGSDLYATLAVARDEAGRTQWIAMHGAPSGTEMNIDAAVAWFPFEAGFIAGHATNTANNAPLSSLVASDGLEFGDDFIDPLTTDGIYDLDLADVGGHSSSGVLLVCGGKNEDNYALSRANADGTFTIFCKDNGSNGASYENDPVAFVYLPFTTEGLVAGRLTERSGATPIVLAGTSGFTASPEGPGRILIRIDGVESDHQGVLLVSPEGGVSRNADNVVVASWDDALAGYLVETLDIPSMDLQGLEGEPMCSFAWIPITPGEGFDARPGTSTVVALPDTQLYAQNIPESFDAQTGWVASETDARDIRM